MISKIPSKFPNYHKELEELNKIYEDLEKSETDEARAMNNEKAMFKRREIEEEYLNMIRIAGGLLASDDLNKVSKILSDEYQILKERAKVYIEIEEFEQKAQMMVRTWDEYYKILDEDPKYKELKEKADAITKRVEEKELKSRLIEILSGIRKSSMNLKKSLTQVSTYQN